MTREKIKTALGWHYQDLSDFEFRLLVPFEPFVLKNSKQVVVKAIMPAKKRGRPCPKCRAPLTVIPSIIPSKQASAYLKSATNALRFQWSALFDGPIRKEVLVNAAIISYQKTARWADASNLYQGTEDAMQAAGVLVDDVQIRTHNDSDRHKRLSGAFRMRSRSPLATRHHRGPPEPGQATFTSETHR